jgi:hypothetical protein
MKSLLAILVLLWSGIATAQSASAVTTTEIAHLFSALEQSNCQFYRNGSWYGPAQASSHLHRKYDYLLKKGLVTSAEAFIDLAASKSSLSGKPYLVRCGGSAPIESNAWFRKKLAEFRNAHTGANNSFKPNLLHYIKNVA